MPVEYLLLLALGVALGLIAYAAIQYGLLKSTSLAWIDDTVIYFLLPVHVSLTQQIMGDKIVDLGWAAAFGVMLPVATLLLATLLGMGRRFVHVPLAAASFGGGNRGIFLLAILAAVSTATQVAPLNAAFASSATSPTILDYFAVMDFTYFFVFSMFLAPSLMQGGVGQTGVEQLKKMIRPLTAILTVVALTVLLPKDWLSPKVADEARFILSQFLTVTSTALVVARLKFGFSFDLAGIIGAMLVSRAGVLLAFAAAAYAGLTLQFIAFEDFAKLLVIFAVFLVVPPSSYITSFIASQGDSSEIDDINRINALWNLLFYILAIASGTLLVLPALV
ncbi:MAG: hypothetical protein ACKVRO_02270 [Micropepsaceae bacterium]